MAESPSRSTMPLTLGHEPGIFVESGLNEPGHWRDESKESPSLADPEAQLLRSTSFGPSGGRRRWSLQRQLWVSCDDALVPSKGDGQKEQMPLRLSSATRPSETVIGRDQEQRSSTKMMSHILTNRSLLRGMPAFHALSACGHILKDAAGDDATFRLSAPVNRIKWFISHNWSVTRWRKFAVLALHFNLLPAVLITCIAMLMILVLSAANYLPTTMLCDGRFWMEKGKPVIQGWTAQVAIPLVFLFSLFTWHEVGGRLGWLKARVFLDKSCISQTNDQLKVQGITSLAAFLGHTDGMLVIYADSYLRKLWTVYELGSVLILAPDVKVVVLPIFLPVFVVFGLLAVSAFYLAQVYVLSGAAQEVLGFHVAQWVRTIGLFLLQFWFALFIRGLAREELRIHSVVEQFDIANVACRSEEDRELVSNSITSFIADKGHVPQGASREDCLMAFNTLVRQKVPGFLIDSLPRQGIPYRIVVAILFPVAAHLIDWLGTAWYNEAPTIALVRKTIRCFGLHILFWPAWVKMTTMCLNTFLNLQGVAEVLFTGAAGAFMSLVGLSVHLFFPYVMMITAHDFYQNLGTEMGFWAALAVLDAVLYVYLPRRRRRSIQAKEDASKVAI